MRFYNTHGQKAGGICKDGHYCPGYNLNKLFALPIYNKSVVVIVHGTSDSNKMQKNLKLLRRGLVLRQVFSRHSSGKGTVSLFLSIVTSIATLQTFGW